MVGNNFAHQITLVSLTKVKHERCSKGQQTSGNSRPTPPRKAALDKYMLSFRLFLLSYFLPQTRTKICGYLIAQIPTYNAFSQRSIAGNFVRAIAALDQ